MKCERGGQILRRGGNETGNGREGDREPERGGQILRRGGKGTGNGREGDREPERGEKETAQFVKLVVSSESSSYPCA